MMFSKSRVNYSPGHHKHRIEIPEWKWPHTEVHVDHHSSTVLMPPHLQLPSGIRRKLKPASSTYATCESISSQDLSDIESGIQPDCEFETILPSEKKQYETIDESIIKANNILLLMNCPIENSEELGHWEEKIYPDECIVPTVSSCLRQIQKNARKQSKSRVPRKEKNLTDKRTKDPLSTDSTSSGSESSGDEFHTALEFADSSSISSLEFTSSRLDSLKDSEYVPHISEESLLVENSGSQRNMDLSSLSSEDTQHYEVMKEDKVSSERSQVIAGSPKSIESIPLLWIDDVKAVEQNDVPLAGNESALSQEKNNFSNSLKLISEEGCGERHSTSSESKMELEDEIPSRQDNAGIPKQQSEEKTQSTEKPHQLKPEEAIFEMPTKLEEVINFPDGDCSDHESDHNLWCNAALTSLNLGTFLDIVHPLPTPYDRFEENTANYESKVSMHQPLACFLPEETEPKLYSGKLERFEVLPKDLFDKPVRIDFLDQRTREPSWVMLFSDKALENAMDESETASPESIWRALSYNCKALPLDNLKGLCKYRAENTETAKSPKIIRCQTDNHHRRHQPQFEREGYVTQDASPMNANFNTLFTNQYKMKFRQYASSANARTLNVITKAKSTRWQRRAGLYNTMFDEKYAADSFDAYAGRMVVLSMHHYLNYLIKMCREMKKNVTYVVYTLSICSPPPKRANPTQSTFNRF